MATGRIVQVMFQNDYHLRKLSLLRGYRTPGSLLTGVHWKPPEPGKSTPDHPVAYRRSAKVAMTVSLQIDPPHWNFRLTGTDPGQKWFQVESGPLVSTGAPQSVAVVSKMPLPDKVALLNLIPVWVARAAPPARGVAELGPSGPHEIFVLYADPITKSSFNSPNLPSYDRLRLLTNLAKGMNDPAEIAEKIQEFVNGQRSLKAGKKITINPAAADVADQIWSLLDTGSGAHGHCGEAGFLMEQMLRMLGIDARQKHVYGRSDKAALRRGDNLVYQDGKKQVGSGPQERDCKVHGKEYLWLNFTRTGYALNAGEGTVEVGGKLYAGLENMIGTKKRGLTPAHDLLLQLQRKYGSKFQVWSHDAETGCELAANQSGAGVPFPPVPAP